MFIKLVQNDMIENIDENIDNSDKNSIDNDIEFVGQIARDSGELIMDPECYF